MRVILLNAISLDGKIALDDGNEDFLSDAGGKYVNEQAKQYGNIIWGHETYENIQKRFQYLDDELKDVKKIIVSKDRQLILKQGYQLASSPQEALLILHQNGLETALLDGGGKLNSSFLQAGLIDEVHLILEPVLVGHGKSVVATEVIASHMKLFAVEKLTPHELLIKYKIDHD